MNHKKLRGCVLLAGAENPIVHAALMMAERGDLTWEEAMMWAVHQLAVAHKDIMRYWKDRLRIHPGLLETFDHNT